MTGTPVLLTGATGLLGRELASRLLRAQRPVLALTRRRENEGPSQGQARVEGLLESESPVNTESLTVGFGDVCRDGLGLSLKARSWLRAWDRPIQIIHCAAETSFDRSQAVLTSTNVGGTRHMVALAEELHAQKQLLRLDHVSTAYVAGDRTDLVLESELDVGQKPRNGYETSKLAAEKLVDAARDRGLPAAVYRPSIIVGDSTDGRVSSFSTLYWPLREFWRGSVNVAIGRPDCPVDAVPVDFVADAILLLSGLEYTVGGTFHLVAGNDRQARLDELVALAEAKVGRRTLRWVDPTSSKWDQNIPEVAREVIQVGKVLLPYTISNPAFDTAVARSILDPAGVVAPDVRECFSTVAEYALQNRFGESVAG